ncbi:MAG: hypothetical protein ACYS7Y_20155 [Planctomycetota bacterium]|jgi:hypothetical protein
MSEITGVYNCEESWEKQSVYTLSNGYTATIEYGHYGDMICRFDWGDGEYWHCSNGLDGLPEFAREWVEVVNPNCGQKLVRPKFRKVSA